jgi:phage terminase large subunit-like protein
VACDVESGYVWTVDIIERPDDAGPDYEHDLHRFDEAVKEMFERFQVWRCYCDPQHIAHLLEGWQNLFGEKRVVEWATYRNRPIAWAVRKFTQAIAAGDFKHSGDDVLTRHVQNSRRRKLNVDDDKQRPMHTLSKPAQHSPLKIDGAMAAVLAWECRGDAIAGWCCLHG